jgi:hypothetical protein
MTVGGYRLKWFSRRRGALIGVLIVGLGTVSGAQILDPALAHAAPRGSYAKHCIIKAPYGKGVKGNGCDLYGAPFWVSGNKLPNGKPNKYVTACGEGMTIAAVVGLVTGPEGFITAVMLGCASSMTQAKVFGS